MPDDVNMIYYSATGDVHRLAEAVAGEAVKAGAYTGCPSWRRPRRSGSPAAPQ
jgi:hypothetical protein